MSAVKAMAAGFSTQKQSMLKDLVEPRERFDVPNHILDTQIFNKLSQNSTIKVKPAVVHFGGYKLDKPLKRKIKICNASAERQNIHIIPPATKYFSIHYTKPDRFVPGFTIEVVINFTADEWRYYYDCIRVHCKGNENIIIPLHAFPVMDTSKFPRKLVFPPSSVSLGESCSKILPLYSHSPIDFEFQITVVQPHPALNVRPMSGIVPGEGEKDIIVTYTPKEYVTANMTIQLAISQFNTEPLQCHITASCTPVVKQITSKSIRDMDDLYKQTKVFDPRSITPLQISRRRQKSPYKKLQNCEIEFEGFQFPAKLNTQHAVNSVLMQEKGKLKVKDLREAVLAKSESKVDASKSSDSLTSAESTRQMKEAAFEKIVRQDVVEERANQLRWQVHLGLDPISDEARHAIAEQRKNAAFVYKYTKRREPFVDQELLRPSSDRNFQRTRRKANEVNKCKAHFDLYKNNSWSVRHRALSRFQQAARTVLIRCRADKKVKMLQKMVEDFKAGLMPDHFPVVVSNENLPTGTSPFQVEAHDHNGFASSDPIDALSSTFIPSKVKPFTFPVYVSPDTKEDIAPDALGEVPFKPTEVVAQRNVPYQDLVVPKYYELAGYTRHSVYECLKNYVPPGLVRPLRVGAEDEIIRGTFASDLMLEGKDTKGEQSVISTEDSKLQISDTISVIQSEAGISTKSVDKQSSSGLIPPSGLFKNPSNHRLYIFNPMPGLVELYIPLEHSEVDPDYHLCPIPRYTMLPNSKKFLHKQDVIKGTMLWKKFSSHGLSSLANTPTLSNAWLPRWSDCLSQAMTPHCTPDLLTNLPEDDEQNLLSEEPSGSMFPLLTPEMIQAHFPTEKDLHEEQTRLMKEEGSPKKEGQISSSRFPSYNSESAGRLGTTMRDERQLLERYGKGIYNKLGERTSQLAKLCDFEIDD